MNEIEEAESRGARWLETCRKRTWDWPSQDREVVCEAPATHWVLWKGPHYSVLADDGRGLYVTPWNVAARCDQHVEQFKDGMANAHHPHIELRQKPTKFHPTKESGQAMWEASE